MWSVELLMMLWIRLGTWGTHFELTENTVGILWEHIGNNKNTTPPHSPERKKNLGPLSGCCFTSLDARIFSPLPVCFAI
jgi:hypothetical protein